MRSLIIGLLLSIAIHFTATNLAFAAGIDLNSATQQELESLPGIGEKTAQEIIAKRPYKSVDDLKAVKGIGDAKVEKLRALVSIGGSAMPGAAPTQTSAPATAFGKGAMPAAAKKLPGAGHLAPGQTVSLNQATAQELEKLPGIGPVKAAAIVAARPFQKKEDVMKVKGIKEGIYKKIEPFLSL